MARKTRKVNSRQDVITLENSKKYNGLHFTLGHTGKMTGFASLSTSPLCNGNCEKNRKIEGSICKECFSVATNKRYTDLSKCIASNTDILTSKIIDPALLPIINRAFFRFEAFGDLNNEIQVINYLNICKKNPHCTFTLWTKIPVIIKKAFDLGYKKPKNLIIIQSALFINTPIKKTYDWIDKTFTVWDSEKTANNAGYTINCGSKKCMGCLLCYTRNNITEIHELLK